MPAEQQRVKSGTGKSGIAITLLLLAILGLLFRSSAQSGLVPFSNDGPLGVLVSQSNSEGEAFTGYWQPLNWIGFAMPSALPNISQGLFSLLPSPVFFAKVYPLTSLLILGLCAWFCFRQLGFSLVVCVLGGLAAALNTNTFSNACWGLPTRALTLAMAFLAVAAIYQSGQRYRWLKLCLAGFAVGMGIMEGFDVGAIFSLYIAALVVFQAWEEHPQKRARGLLIGGMRLAVVALAAAVISAHGLYTLITTQIQGITGTQQNAQTKEQRWDGATMWSLPKIETLRVVVPGLYGYRMDSPNGAQYWGSVGQQPGWMETKQGLPRHSGSGEYAGVFVVLVALWGLWASFRQSEFLREKERRYIWFWSVLALVSVLLSWGRHAPFYQFVYALPYFSTIRLPIKFMHPFHLSLLILFGYGLQGLWRCWQARHPTMKTGSLLTRWKQWWKTAPEVDRRWVTGMVFTLIGVSVATLVYAASKTELMAHLQSVGFDDAGLAAATAQFSVMELLWSALFLLLSIGIILLLLSGVWNGAGARWVWILAGIVIVADLGRASQPWIVYYDYTQKYAPDPVVDYLQDQKGSGYRVTSRLNPLLGAQLIDQSGAVFGALCSEWNQHHFQYYAIPTLDTVQLPRVPELDDAMFKQFAPTDQTRLPRVGRLWELTSTRYILGMAGYLNLLNEQIDPGKKRFRILERFTVVTKPGIDQATLPEHLTVVSETNGPFALFEFTGARPRAELYPHWQVETNDQVVLDRLAAPSFVPGTDLLVSQPIPAPIATTNTVPGQLSLDVLTPRRLQLQAQCATPNVLLLTDRWDPDWHVTVDGAEAPLLRCNYLFRGVYLEPGKHTVEFTFSPPSSSLWWSLAGIVAGLGICGFLLLSPAKKSRERQPTAPAT